MSVLPPGPLRIVALIVTVALTWIIVSIFLGGPGSGFSRIQQLFISECGTLPCLATEVPMVATWARGLRLRLGVGGAWISFLFLRLSPGIQHSLLVGRLLGLSSKSQLISSEPSWSGRGLSKGQRDFR